MADTEDFAALLRQSERKQAGPTKPEPQVGDRVRGVVVSIAGDCAFVSLGAKSEGTIALADLTDAEGRLTVSVGDAINAVVLSEDAQSGTLLLGGGSGRRVHDSSGLEHAFRHGLPVEGLVTGLTKGGVEVQIAGVRAFCPASQIDTRYIEDLQEFVGQRLTFRITRYQDAKHPNLVLSRRVLLEEEGQARAAETRARLEVGAVLQGTVTALKDYGAFIDLGGVEGMVHVSEIAFGRVSHPKEVLSVGQPVEVAVLRIEKTDNPKHPERIALSIRALARDPWQDAEQRFAVGIRVKGTVTRLAPFGAFVELIPGIEGLVHLSELGAGRRIAHPHEVVKPGDAVEAKVVSVDTAKRRIALSLDIDREPDAADPEAQAYMVDQAPASSLGSFGELLRKTLDNKDEHG